MPRCENQAQRQRLRFTFLHPSSLVPSTFHRPRGEDGDCEGRDTKRVEEVKEVARNTELGNDTREGTYTQSRHTTLLSKRVPMASGIWQFQFVSLEDQVWLFR